MLNKRCYNQLTFNADVLSAAVRRDYAADHEVKNALLKKILNDPADCICHCIDSRLWR